MTINHTEKGDGLNAAIRAAGEWLREENGKFIASDEAIVQAIIDGYTLSDAASHIILQLDAYAAKLRNRATAGYSPGEMASWSTKVIEAKAYQVSGKSTDSPSLSIEASIRGISIDGIINRVLAGAARLMALECAIAGIKGKHADTLRMFKSFEEINTYDWSTGWPEV